MTARIRREPFTAADFDRPFGLPLTREEGRALLAKPKRSKFNVDRSEDGVAKRTIDGIVFDSQREAVRYGELRLLQSRGMIRNLELQPAYCFGLNGKVIFKYVADFAYFEGNGRVIEDVKGVQTAVFRLKLKLIEAQFGIRITVTA